MNEPRVVVGVIIEREGKILVCRSRKWKDIWIIPGGHVEWGESFEECARREVKEETNLELSDVHFMQIQEAIFPEEFHEKRHFIFIDMWSSGSGELELNDELHEPRWITVESALALPMNKYTRKIIEKYKEITQP